MFANVVLPVLFTALVGFVYARLTKTELRTLTRLTLYVLVPCLVFTSLLETEVSGREVGQVAVFAILLTIGITAIVMLVNRLMGLNSEQGNALLLTSVFMNTGNYGLPVVLYAVGSGGFARAVIFMVVETFLLYSVGVYFAASGRLDPKRALLAIVRLPTFHAAVLALAFRSLGLVLPEGIMDTLSSLGEAGIILMLVALGIQLAQADVKLPVAHLSVASVIRLVVSPLIALGLVNALHMTPVTAQAMIIEAAMPTAVITSVLAVEFGSAPALVSSIIFATTISSFASVSAVLTLLF